MSHRKMQLIVMCWLASLACSCTTQTAKRVTSDDNTTQGVRYWLSSPYLLVTDRVRIRETQTVYVGLGINLVPVVECVAPACTPKTEQDRARESSAGVSAEASDTPQQGGGSSESGGKSEGEDGKSPKPASESGAAASPASSGVSIVWLPDYCEQYAYESKSFLAKADATVSLADGWRLESVISSQDSTVVVSKLLDLVGIRTQADAATKQARIAGAQLKPSLVLPGVPAYWIRTEAWDLNPGLYPVFQRTDCKTMPTFNPKTYDIKQSVSWTRLTPGN